MLAAALLLSSLSNLGSRRSDDTSETGDSIFFKMKSAFAEEVGVPVLESLV
jgi:hypothetical protein